MGFTPIMTAIRPSSDAGGGRARARRPRGRGGRRWLRYLAIALAVPLVFLSAAAGYYYVTFSRMIDARLHGERERAVPRIFARPFEIRPGDAISLREMIDRLNDLGYANRAQVAAPHEFAIGREALALIPHAGSHEGQTVRILFSGTAERGAIRAIATVPPTGAIGRLTLEPPLITALEAAARSAATCRCTHPAADGPGGAGDRGPPLLRASRASIRSAWAAPVPQRLRHKPYLASGSTLTQQLVKNTFLSPEKTLRRKVTGAVHVGLILERRLSKDEILELYLNDVYSGQRGSFAIRGVGEAARLFFGKDVSNVRLAEAATIAGVIQSPSRLSPFNHPERARERRNVVLRAMAETGFVSAEAPNGPSRNRSVVARARSSRRRPTSSTSIRQEAAGQYPAAGPSGDVYTTLDVHLQRVAQDALREGLARSTRSWRGGGRQPQAALVAIDPRTGEVLALVGGRSYNQSQYNRAVSARRQPGSVFKPFVYLAAFERAHAEGRTDLTPATSSGTSRPSSLFNEQVYHPGNYDHEYDGAITFRRALALSRNVAAVKVAQSRRLRPAWPRSGGASAQGTPARPYPSIALGVFEASPIEIATAYTLFANGGVIRPARAIGRIDQEGRSTVPSAPRERRVARADTTFLVTHMMRSVLNEGTGASARGAGFAADAAAKSGTTNDLRDAWFVGFTPELLTVVWVGLDDNRPLGLSGTQAALPIWTAFMKRAVAGRRSPVFETPDGVVFAEIDRDTGLLAAPGCPRVFREAFLAGESPDRTCLLHTFYN
jgi:penicillin-binding protein 1B